MPSNARSLSNHRAMNPNIASPAVYSKNAQGQQLLFLYSRTDHLLNQEEANYVRRMQLEVRLKGKTLCNIHLDPNHHPISWPVFIGYDGQAIAYYHHRIIGQGRFGTVHLGVNIDTGEPVAVKVTKPNFGQSFFKARAGSFSRNSRFAKMFKNGLGKPQVNREPLPKIMDEAGLCGLTGSLVDHANIKMNGDSRVFIAQKLIWGNTLNDVFKSANGQNRNMPFSQKLKVLLESAKAVHRFHGLGYFHRDLKSSNVMWDSQEQKAHLIDFGKAVPISNNPYPIDLYAFNAAPECLEAYTKRLSQYPFSLASEMYSFGIMSVQLMSKYSHDYIQDTTIKSAEKHDLDQTIPKAFIEVVDDIYQRVDRCPLKRLCQLLLWKMTSIDPKDRPGFDWVICQLELLMKEAYGYENFDHRHQDFKLSVKGQILLKDLEQLFKERIDILEARSFNKQLKVVTKDMKNMEFNYIKSLYIEDTPKPKSDNPNMDQPLLAGYIENSQPLPISTAMGFRNVDKLQSSLGNLKQMIDSSLRIFSKIFYAADHEAHIMIKELNSKVYSLPNFSSMSNQDYRNFDEACKNMLYILPDALEKGFLFKEVKDHCKGLCDAISELRYQMNEQKRRASSPARLTFD